MLKPKIEKAINEQINFELFSSYLYFSMHAYFKSISLDGAANWMEIQVQEELFHVKKFTDYVNDRRARVTLDAIDKPPFEWASPIDAFQNAFNHEQIVSERINNLVSLALQENDAATYNFLQWFVNEQVEEEASVDQIVQRLKLVEGNGTGLFMIDQELLTRVLNLPTAGK